MRAFVTGGTGFVGGNLVRLLLRQGYDVRALVRSNSCLDNLQNLDIEIVEGDICDRDLNTKMANCQVLFHVAACYSLWKKDRPLLYRSNVEGTKNILACARKAKIERTVYTSSVAAIGVGEDGNIVDERHQTPVAELISDYKKSKYYGERVAIEARQLGQDIVIVNPTTPIGKLDIKPTPTGDIILRFLRRQMPFYVETGLNLIDVEDVVWGHLLALEKGRIGERYILGNENLSLKTILNKLGAITDLPIPKNSIPYWIPLTTAWIGENILPNKKILSLDSVKMSKKKMYYNSSKAIRELSLPQSSVDIALEKAVNWFKNKFL